MHNKKKCEKSDNDNYQKIYTSMARMNDNDQSPSKDFGDSSQLTNCILDSGLTCYMTSQVSDLSQVH